MLSPVSVGTVMNVYKRTTEANIILNVYNLCGLEDPGFESWQGASFSKTRQIGYEARPASY
jgi:hypothetical protein